MFTPPRDRLANGRQIVGADKIIEYIDSVQKKYFLVPVHWDCEILAQCKMLTVI